MIFPLRARPAAPSIALLLLAAAAGCARREAAPPSGAAAEAPSTGLRFEEGAASAGVAFHHHADRGEERYMPEIMGSGVALVDVNRDGAPDLLCVDGGDLESAARPAEAANRLFLNDGRGRFRDVTAAWGLASAAFGMGVAAGDVDNDGWTDLYFTTWGGGDRLLRNTGTRFEDVTAASGVRPDPGWSTSAGFFDLENDGDLDLWVLRYVDYSLANAIRCYTNQIHVYCTPDLYPGAPDLLLRNDGGRFTDVSRAIASVSPPGKGLALTLGDPDGDGDVDPYVVNDLTPNELWVNEGGRLAERGMLSGAALSGDGREQAGMGSDLADFDGDGRYDLLTINYQGETNGIYRQVGDLFFQEVSDRVGVGEASRARLGFGCDFFDADNDGDEDLAVANGHIDDQVESHQHGVTFAQANLLFENGGEGRLREVSAGAGPAFAAAGVNRGLASGDLDGDGDLDLVISRNGGPLQIARNESAPRGRFVSLWLEGRRANRSAIGALVTARAGSRVLRRQVLGASSYLSVSDARVHLGLGPAARVDSLEIRWPGGAVQRVGALEADAFYRVVEGESPQAYVPGRVVISP